MKLVFGMIIICCLMTGCIQYGKGEAVGYVNAVDDGIIWDHVWFKTSMETSREDCYLINDEQIKSDLRALVGTNKIKIKYSRHFMTLSMCGGEGDGSNDEIISFEVIQ